MIDGKSKSEQISFVKLKTHIVGAYGDYELLKPYYDSNGWKFKVSDQIRWDGVNVGPGCFFSLKKADILLPLMEEDGWDIGGVAELVNAMKTLVEANNKAKEAEKKAKKMEEEKKRQEEAKRNKTINFKYLWGDEFVVYGNDSYIKTVLQILKYPTVVKCMYDLNIWDTENGYVLTYMQLLPFIDKMKGEYNISHIREWAESYVWDIANPEMEPSRTLHSIQDINRFFEWCFNNQTILYAGTLDKQYKKLKQTSLMKHFIPRLIKLFKRATNISPECKEWYQLHEPKFAEDSDIYAGMGPRAWLISTGMRD